MRSRNQRIDGRAAILAAIQAAGRSSTYPRSCSGATSDVVAREGLYTCGMTATNALGKRPAGSYDRLPSGRIGGTIRTNWLVACVATEEKNTMISPETPPARGTLRGDHAQLSCKRIMIGIVTLALAATSVLAGSSAATAAPGCDKPGVCPNPPVVQINEQQDGNEQPTENQRNGQSPSSQSSRY